MTFFDTALHMVGLAIPILVGYLARRLGLMGPELDGRLSKLVVNVTLPCMIVASACARELPSASDILQLLCFSALGYLVAMAIALAAPRLMRAPADEAGSHSFMIAFGNVGFIGFPVISAMLGADAVLLASIANIPWYVFVSSAGLLMISGVPAGGVREVAAAFARRALSPMLAASLIVLALALLGINDLGVLGDGLATCGNFTTPAALLIAGSSLASYSAKEMLSNPRAYVSVALRLAGVPLALLLALGGLVESPLALAVIVLGQAMPVATNGTLYCLMYEVDPKTMMQGTFLSILASILTIPLVATLVGA